mgnify:CR=1 FL=1
MYDFTTALFYYILVTSVRHLRRQFDIHGVNVCTVDYGTTNKQWYIVLQSTSRVYILIASKNEIRKVKYMFFLHTEYVTQSSNIH